MLLRGFREGKSAFTGLLWRAVLAKKPPHAPQETSHAAGLPASMTEIQRALCQRPVCKLSEWDANEICRNGEPDRSLEASYLAYMPTYVWTSV